MWDGLTTSFLPLPLRGWCASRGEGEVGPHAEDPAVPVVGQGALLFESRADPRLYRDPRMLRLANELYGVQIIIISPHPYVVFDLLVHLHHPGQDGGVQDSAQCFSAIWD